MHKQAKKLHFKAFGALGRIVRICQQGCSSSERVVSVEDAIDYLDRKVAAAVVKEAKVVTRTQSQPRAMCTGCKRIKVVLANPSACS